MSEELKTLKVKINKYLPYYYAGASGDFNLIHIDNDFAKKVGLGGIILQGLCTMAYVFRCAVSVTDDPYKLKKIKVRFRGIVRPEDEITIRGKIISTENNSRIIDLIAENQNSEQIITNAQAIVEIN